MNKQSFTLLEMLIVIVLISTSFSVIAIQIPKALKMERFEVAVEAVIAKITLAQELMLDYRTDVTLTLAQDKRGIRCDFKLDQPMSRKVKAKLKKNLAIRGIETIAFNGEPTPAVDLLFDGTLGATPRGRLLLGSKKHKTTLILQGYPAKILREDDNLAEETHASYPEEILSTL